MVTRAIFSNKLPQVFFKFFIRSQAYSESFCDTCQRNIRVYRSHTTKDKHHIINLNPVLNFFSDGINIIRNNCPMSDCPPYGVKFLAQRRSNLILHCPPHNLIPYSNN
eukprot:Gb_39450 [translate_table: standard]